MGLTSQGDPSHQLWSPCQPGDHNLVSAGSISSREGHVTSGFTVQQSTGVPLAREHPGVKDTVS